MTESIEIGSYEREVLAALREIGEAQRSQGDKIAGIEVQLVEIKKQTFASVNVLSQRVVSLEGRVASHQVQIGTLEGQSAALTARANATDKHTASLTGWPLRLVAGGVVIGALALLVIAVALLLLLVLR